jgi:small-conductance mechanosensitive channel
MVDPRITYTLSAIIIVVILNMILKGYLGHKIRKLMPKNADNLPFKEVVNIAFFLLFAIVILAIWGVSLESLWVFLTGVAALIAVAFVAVWSILSNLLAGMIIVGMKKLRIGDEVIILPEKIKGKVVSIGILFFTIRDAKYDTSIPNNQYFQKFVKIKRK